MKSFYYADGIIQGILALSCITGVLSFPLHLPIFFPAIYSFYALLGWQLFSSLVQVLLHRKVKYNPYLYAFHLVLMGFFAILAIIMALGMWGVNIVGNGLGLSLFYIGLMIVLPLLMLVVSILSVRRLCVLLFFDY